MIRLGRGFLFLAAIFATILAVTVSASAATQEAPNNYGLVGYWPLDEGTSTIAHDMSGRGTGGALSSPAPTWVSGRHGKALSFDGSSTSVSIPSVGSYPAVTYSVWVYPTSLAKSYNSIIDHNGWSQNVIHFQVRSDGRLEFSNQSDTPQDQYSVATLPLNQWSHIVVTYDSSTKTATFYMNGKLDVQRTYTSAANALPSPAQIGGWDGGGRNFKGSIDDVRIYNRALSAAEVQALYNDHATAENNSTANLDNGSSLENGLVGLWTFDSGTIGSTIRDLSGSGNNGYTDGSVATSSMTTMGRLGQAIALNGSSSYIKLGLIPATDFSGSSFAISAWVYSSRNASLGSIFDAWQSPWSYRLFANGSGVQFHLRNTAGNDIAAGSGIAAAIPDKKWNHVVAVYNYTSASSATMLLYVNGALANSAACSANCTLMSNAAGVPRLIGKKGDSAGYFNGRIDDVRVYNRALSAAEVKQLYLLGGSSVNTSSANLDNGSSLEKGLVGHWTFDGNSINWKSYTVTNAVNSNLASISTTGLSTPIATSTAPTVGKHGQALTFRGGLSSGDYMSTGAASAYSISSSATFAAWLKIKSFPPSTARMGIVSQRQGGTGVNFDIAGADACGQGKLEILEGGSGGTCGNITLSPSVWYHVVAVLNGTSRLIYVNGTLDSSTSGSWTWPSSGGPTVASANGGSNYFFDGALDDVRIYNRALSAAEVKQLYQLAK